MENWGAILDFREVPARSIRRSPARRPRTTSTPRRRTRVAHQWFGDIVTMAWWDDLWLNEGFASWMETKASDHFNPDWYPLLSASMGAKPRWGSMPFATTHPVVQPVRTVSEANQAFDSDLLFEGRSGDRDARGLCRRGHLARRHPQPTSSAHRYGNTTSDDLWGAVEQAGAAGHHPDRARFHAPAGRSAGPRRGAMPQRPHRADPDAERVQPRPHGAGRREAAALARAAADRAAGRQAAAAGARRQRLARTAAAAGRWSSTAASSAISARSMRRR